jgi:orotidine-5'-phosphate decarboxylase
VVRHFADRLTDAIVAKGAPAVVNIDPVLQSLPSEFRTAGSSGGDEDRTAALQGIRTFCLRVIDIVAPLVPAVKFNIACFEPYRAAGIQVYDDLIAESSRRGLIVIGDVKRGDVGHTAALYAQAHLDEPNSTFQTTADAITLNGYLGWDGVKPFVDVAREKGKGVFILVRTSNASADSIQDLVTRDGRKVHDVVASLVAQWADDSSTLGHSGYTSVGAVVATRRGDDAARLRAAMSRSIFLVPGYGAQGGEAEDYKHYFKQDGTGAIVAAGRSIVFAYEAPAYRQRFPGAWDRCVEQACRDFVADLRRILPG